MLLGRDRETAVTGRRADNPARGIGVYSRGKREFTSVAREKGRNGHFLGRIRPAPEILRWWSREQAFVDADGLGSLVKNMPVSLFTISNRAPHRLAAGFWG